MKVKFALNHQKPFKETNFYDPSRENGEEISVKAILFFLSFRLIDSYITFMKEVWYLGTIVGTRVLNQ